MGRARRAPHLAPAVRPARRAAERPLAAPPHQARRGRGVGRGRLPLLAAVARRSTPTRGAEISRDQPRSPEATPPTRSDPRRRSARRRRRHRAVAPRRHPLHLLRPRRRPRRALPPRASAVAGAADRAGRGHRALVHGARAAAARRGGVHMGAPRVHHRRDFVRGRRHRRLGRPSARHRHGAPHSQPGSLWSAAAAPRLWLRALLCRRAGQEAGLTQTRR
mmetsp:Transcript_9071/g.29994  ORF Transcript_9071/g.29994 Transcript_9071/m.29994 type:complete len:220 (-) Transcript_9071:2-661(-)